MYRDLAMEVGSLKIGQSDANSMNDDDRRFDFWTCSLASECNLRFQFSSYYSRFLLAATTCVWTTQHSSSTLLYLADVFVRTILCVFSLISVAKYFLNSFGAHELCKKNTKLNSSLSRHGMAGGRGGRLLRLHMTLSSNWLLIGSPRGIP